MTAWKREECAQKKHGMHNKLKSNTTKVNFISYEIKPSIMSSVRYEKLKNDLLMVNNSEQGAGERRSEIL